MANFHGIDIVWQQLTQSRGQGCSVRQQRIGEVASRNIVDASPLSAAPSYETMRLEDDEIEIGTDRDD